jgi:UDP-N-acetylmuramoyl-tripeptide--D-alanyl-D-alanine ligase
VTPDGAADARLALPGRHNVLNALAAAAATWAAGWSLDEIVAGLAGVAGVKGRMSLRKARCGALLIDDTYNANPRAVRRDRLRHRAAGRDLAGARRHGRARPRRAELHAAAGRYAREHGVARLYALGPDRPRPRRPSARAGISPTPPRWSRRSRPSCRRTSTCWSRARAPCASRP